MNTKPLMAALLAGAVLTTGCASAGPHGHRHGHDRHHYDDYATVLRVKPIYETVDIRIPEERCWDEEVSYSRHSHDGSYTKPLVGAILGGVVGNQFGNKSGKTALTVAGSLLGASIGRDLRSDHQPGYSYRTETHCETVDRYETREEIVGYRVKYRYKGRVYHTRMDHDPGDTLRVGVSVKPRH